MPSIGSVKSTALTGGEAPVFEGAAKEAKAATKAATKTTDEVKELRAELNEFKSLLLEALASKDETASTETKEETPQEKAAKTRAAKKEAESK